MTISYHKMQIIDWFKRNPIGRYVAPFVVFMLFTELQRFGGETGIFWIYALKTIATGLMLWFCFKDYRYEIAGRADTLAVLVGLLVLLIWVIPVELSGREHSISFDPTAFDSMPLVILAVIVRTFGAAIIVPVMEELIWRSCLMRYLIKSDFLDVKLGTYSHFSFWITVIAFMLVHRGFEWPMAFATGVLYGAYLVRTKNLVGCIIAHATTNLGLALYVIVTGKWYYW